MRTYTAYNSAVEMRDVRRECKEIGKGWIKLNEDLHLLERHKSSLKEEWNQIESQRERLVRARRKFEKSVQQEWFFAGDPTDDEAARQRTVRLNIGGECFNVQARLLLKDRFSLLAATALPAQDSVIKPGVDGCFYFDRDWWLFRHILAYLRDAILPMKEPLLRDLYHEAAFYCLTSLQRDVHIALTKLREEKAPTIEPRPEHEQKVRRSSREKKSKRRCAKGKRNRTKYRSGSEPLPDPHGFVSASPAVTYL